MTAYFALLGFIAFMVGTPGPANLLAMLAGVRQGLRDCIGFICGLVFGKILLNLLIGFGFGVGVHRRHTTHSLSPPSASSPPAGGAG